MALSDALKRRVRARPEEDDDMLDVESSETASDGSDGAESDQDLESASDGSDIVRYSLKQLVFLLSAYTKIEC